MAFLRTRFKRLVQLIKRRVLGTWVWRRLVVIPARTWVVWLWIIHLRAVRWHVINRHVAFMLNRYCLLQLINSMNQIHVLFSWDNNSSRILSVLWVHGTCGKFRVFDRTARASVISWPSYGVIKVGLHGGLRLSDKAASRLILRGDCVAWRLKIPCGWRLYWLLVLWVIALRHRV
jgi:hypothetical protein